VGTTQLSAAARLTGRPAPSVARARQPVLAGHFLFSAIFSTRLPCTSRVPLQGSRLDQPTRELPCTRHEAAYPAPRRLAPQHLQGSQPRRPTLHLPPHARPSQPAYPAPLPRQTIPRDPSLSQIHSPTPPTRPRQTQGPASGKSRRRTAYPQQIVTTRLLYCLQDRFAQLSRLQRI
jgi:hypothetical protein